MLHTEEKVRDWVQGGLFFLAHAPVFPSSSVAWRTSHPYSAYCAHPALLRSMNAAARGAARLGYAIMEWGDDGGVVRRGVQGGCTSRRSATCRTSTGCSTCLRNR